ncbi:hypothetical protein FXB39_09800 [Nocardioides sp. BGMRC 2183]|nr:hypothetical protein FXB39_09800 [Nocardioides sp. BGMRC 2183]
MTYDDWLVWDGAYGPVRVGGDFVASVEFIQQSSLLPVAAAAQPHLEHISESRYLATARVLDTEGAVVLDLGALRALRWVRPGETPGDFETGMLARFELFLGLNPWDNTPETNRAAELYGTDHRWHVHRIVLKTVGQDGEREIDSADTDTVDSDSEEYCLLECTVVDD